MAARSEVKRVARPSAGSSASAAVDGWLDELEALSDPSVRLDPTRGAPCEDTLGGGLALSNPPPEELALGEAGRGGRCTELDEAGIGCWCCWYAEAEKDRLELALGVPSYASK